MASASYKECMALIAKCKNKKEWRACFEAVEDRQQEMTDGEYLELMGHFTAGRLYCTCVSDDSLCTTSLDDVLECRNFGWHRRRWPAIGFIELAIRPAGYSYQDFLDFRLPHRLDIVQPKGCDNESIGVVLGCKRILDPTVQLGEHPKRFEDAVPTDTLIKSVFALYSIPHENQLLNRVRLLYLVVTMASDPELKGPVAEQLIRIVQECDGTICYTIRDLIGWGDCPFKVLREDLIKSHLLIK